MQPCLAASTPKVSRRIPASTPAHTSSQAGHQGGIKLLALHAFFIFLQMNEERKEPRHDGQIISDVTPISAQDLQLEVSQQGEIKATKEIEVVQLSNDVVNDSGREACQGAECSSECSNATPEIFHRLDPSMRYIKFSECGLSYKQQLV